MLLPMFGRAILLSFTIRFSGPWVKATDCPFIQKRFSQLTLSLSPRLIYNPSRAYFTSKTAFFDPNLLATVFLARGSSIH